jgi:hypothetical protein
VKLDARREENAKRKKKKPRGSIKLFEKLWVTVALTRGPRLPQKIIK